MPGRGRSDWLEDASAYSFPFYLAVLGALYARLDVPAVHWVGHLDGRADRHAVRRAAEIAGATAGAERCRPVLPKEGLERIGQYVGRDPGFSNRQELEAYLRDVHAGFGALSDAQWRHLAEHSGRTRSDRRLGLAYDPKIGEAFRPERRPAAAGYRFLAVLRPDPLPDLGDPRRPVRCAAASDASR